MSHGLSIHDGTGMIAQDPVSGKIFAYGTTFPADGTVGFAPGCLFLDIDATTEATYWYLNVGTKASSNFDVIDFNIAESAFLSGITATAAEINRVAKVSTRVVDVTGTSVTLSAALHDGKTVTLTNSAVAVTLPAATGTFCRYRMVVVTAATNTVITATGAHMFGMAIYESDNATDGCTAYGAAGSTTLTMNGSTQGGLKGAVVELEDIATNVWVVRYTSQATGSEVTPFT